MTPDKLYSIEEIEASIADNLAAVFPDKHRLRLARQLADTMRENERLREALSNISRMRTLPDHASNTFKLYRCPFCNDELPEDTTCPKDHSPPDCGMSEISLLPLPAFTAWRKLSGKYIKLMRENNENCRLLGKSGERGAALLAQIDGLRRENERLCSAFTKYGSHPKDCNFFTGENADCDCGYIDIAYKAAFNRNKHSVCEHLSATNNVCDNCGVMFKWQGHGTPVEILHPTKHSSDNRIPLEGYQNQDGTCVVTKYGDAPTKTP